MVHDANAAAACYLTSQAMLASCHYTSAALPTSSAQHFQPKPQIPTNGSHQHHNKTLYTFHAPVATYLPTTAQITDCAWSPNLATS